MPKTRLQLYSPLTKKNAPQVTRSYQKLTHRTRGHREGKEVEKLAMEYGYPANWCGNNKEKRPPLKRGQLKMQIAKTLMGSLMVPAGAANRERSFGR
nr:unnamed protein product [Digitaria exilis]